MSDPDRNELAESRTELAEDRTLLAHERSFAGWVRTGLALVGVGIAFNALFEALSPTWVAKAIASVFLALACFIFLSASRRACGGLGRLDAHKISALQPIRVRLLAWSLVAATTALLAAIWLLTKAP